MKIRQREDSNPSAEFATEIPPFACASIGFHDIVADRIIRADGEKLERAVFVANGADRAGHFAADVLPVGRWLFILAQGFVKHSGLRTRSEEVDAAFLRGNDC